MAGKPCYLRVNDKKGQTAKEGPPSYGFIDSLGANISEDRILVQLPICGHGYRKMQRRRKQTNDPSSNEGPGMVRLLTGGLMFFELIESFGNEHFCKWHGAAPWRDLFNEKKIQGRKSWKRLNQRTWITPRTFTKSCTGSERLCPSRAMKSLKNGHL